MSLIKYEAPPDGDVHDELGRPFRVVAKLKNNRLIRAREQLGHMTTVAAARAIGVDNHLLGTYEAMTRSPWNKKRGGWNESALRIAHAYAYHPEELWPDVIQSVRATSATLELAEPVMAVAADFDAKELTEQTRKALATLTPREEKVLRKRFGIGERSDQTLEEVAEDFDVHRERIRQIEGKALRKLRHPALSKALKPFVLDDPSAQPPQPPRGTRRVTCPGCGRVTVENAHHPYRTGSVSAGTWRCDRTAMKEQSPRAPSRR